MGDDLVDDVQPAEAEAVLRTLPEWFGVEAALIEYRDDVARFPTLGWREQGRLAGFLTLRRHFSESAEVHCLAVSRDRRRSGIGRALVEAAAGRWRQQGGRLLQVKTIGPSSLDVDYALTREFYLALGFVPLEEFNKNLWPGYHVLQLVKWLD